MNEWVKNETQKITKEWTNPPAHVGPKGRVITKSRGKVALAFLGACTQVYIRMYIYHIFAEAWHCMTLSRKHSFHPFSGRTPIKTAWVNASTILPCSFLNQHPRPILRLFYMDRQNKILLASRDNNTLPCSFLETKALITYKSIFVGDKNRFL